MTRAGRRDHVQHSVPELVFLVMTEPSPLLEKMLGNLQPQCLHERSISGHARRKSRMSAVRNSPRSRAGLSGIRALDRGWVISIVFTTEKLSRAITRMSSRVN